MSSLMVDEPNFLIKGGRQQHHKHCLWKLLLPYFEVFVANWWHWYRQLPIPGNCIWSTVTLDFCIFSAQWQWAKTVWRKATFLNYAKSYLWRLKLACLSLDQNTPKNWRGNIILQMLYKLVMKANVTRLLMCMGLNFNWTYSQNLVQRWRGRIKPSGSQRFAKQRRESGLFIYKGDFRKERLYLPRSSRGKSRPKMREGQLVGRAPKVW